MDKLRFFSFLLKVSRFLCLVEWGFKALKKFSEPEWAHYHQGSAENKLQAGAAQKILMKSKSAANVVYKAAYKC